MYSKMLIHSCSQSLDGHLGGGGATDVAYRSTYEYSSQKIAACLSLSLSLSLYIYIYIYIHARARLYWVLILKADSSGRADYGLGLRSFGCWDCGF